MLKHHEVSERRACQLVDVSRSVLRYRPASGNDAELEERIRALAGEHPRYGYLRTWALLRRAGHAVNRKRVHRLWRKLKLQVPRRRKKRRYVSTGQVPLRAERPNHVWTWDFIYDTTVDGRTLRCLTVSDEFTREGLAIRTRRRFPAARAVEVLEELIVEHGAPHFLRSDNGPEFIAAKLKTWLVAHGIQTYYIEPGSPWQNAYGESFNGKFRDECLNMEVYFTDVEAQTVHERYRRQFNTERPHSSLGYLTPAEFKARWQAGAGGSAPRPPEFARWCQSGQAGQQKNGCAVKAQPDRLGPCVGARGRSPALPLSSAQVAGQCNRKAVELNLGRRTSHHDWT